MTGVRLDQTGDLGAGQMLRHKADERKTFVDERVIANRTFCRSVPLRRGSFTHWSGSDDRRSLLGPFFCSVSTASAWAWCFGRLVVGRNECRRSLRNWHRTTGFFRPEPNLRPLCVAHRLAAAWPAHRRAVGEDPSEPRDWLSTDEPPPLEQPVVGTVKLLERVVGENGCPQFVGNLENETVAAPNGPGGWCDDLAGVVRRFEDFGFGRVNSVCE